MIPGNSWRHASASVVGTSHVRDGSMCQDAHRCRVFTDADGHQTLVVAVSDGAGSASHGGSGSVLTCDALLEQAELFLEGGGSVDQFCSSDAATFLTVVREIIADKAGEKGLTLRDFASTLLFAMVCDDAAIFAQVGDGAIVVRENSDLRCVFWPQRGEFINTTFFVTDNAALNNLQFEKREQVTCEELALFSDGIEPLVLQYAAKAVHAPFFNRVFDAVRRSTVEGSDSDLCSELERYLGSNAINERTDDDKTLVLASRIKPQATSSNVTDELIEDDT